MTAKFPDGKHTVTATFDRGYSASYRLNCESPANAACRAHYTCNCEEWLEVGIDNDGNPYHESGEIDEDGEEFTERHVGKFTNECRLDDWFDESDDPLEGKITFPVTAEWNGDGYTFGVGDQ